MGVYVIFSEYKMFALSRYLLSNKKTGSHNDICYWLYGNSVA